MRTNAPRDLATHLLQDPDYWITRAGKFLRKTSLDELPQLINIIRGEMSIVGPRPALWNQDDLITLRDQYGANDVVPGLTGWAQVNGRDSISLEEKARLDGEYASHISFSMDIKCLLLTVGVVLNRKGYSEGQDESNSSNS
jgi:O-antigen biosynthesis protein WbqP